MDDFLADVHTVVSVNLVDFIDSNDIGTMDAQKLFRWQHLFYGLHGEVSDEWFGLIVEIEHHVVFDTTDVGDLVDNDVTPLTIDSKEDSVWLW